MGWANLLVSFFGAVLSALGMGGGGILLIYLTAYGGMEQQAAQGLNLLFFIPIASVALCIHAKNRLIRWRLVWPCVLVGAAGVWLGARLALAVDPGVLRKLFGVFLLGIGFRELFSGGSGSKKALPKDREI